MEKPTIWGARIAAAAMAAFGAQHALAFLKAAPEPGPPFYPMGPLALAIVAIVFFAGAIALASARPNIGRVAQRGAFGIAGYFVLHLLVVMGPKLAAKPTHAGLWTVAFELVAIAAGFVALGVAVAPERLSKAAGAHLLVGARTAFAVGLWAFGVLHFMYAEFVATLVPAWIPARLFWSIGVGVGFVAAGLAIATRIRAKLAGYVLAAMYGSWVLILHLPRAFAAQGTGNEWTSTFVALTMCGLSLAITYKADRNQAPASRTTPLPAAPRTGSSPHAT